MDIKNIPEDARKMLSQVNPDGYFGLRRAEIEGLFDRLPALQLMDVDMDGTSWMLKRVSGATPLSKPYRAVRRVEGDNKDDNEFRGYTDDTFRAADGWWN